MRGRTWSRHPSTVWISTCPVFVGDLLFLRGSLNLTGNTSMEVGVRVEAENLLTGELRHTASAYITFVALDSNGRPRPVPQLILEGGDEERRHREAKARREARCRAHRSDLRAIPNLRLRGSSPAPQNIRTDPGLSSRSSGPKPPRAGLNVRIAAIYVLLGGFWILFSDRVLAFFIADPLALTRFQTYKGWFYVAATAALLYVLIRRFAEERRSAGEALRAAMQKAEEEQARTQAIIAAMGDGISIQDADFRILFQNQKHKDLVGDHRGEFCYAAYQHGDRICEGCPVALSYRDGGIHTVERSAVTDNGTLFAEITASSVRDADGRIVAGIEIVRNITGRKRTEDALRDSEKKYRDLVDTALVVYRTTVSGTFTRIKRLHMLGYDSAEHDSCGKAAPLQQTGTAEALLSCCSSGVTNFELELKTRSGGTKYVLISATLDNGTLSGMLLDITERKHAEEFVKNVLEAVDEAFVVIGRDFRILLANHAYADQVGMDVDDIIGKHCYEVSHKQQQPCYETGEECTVRKTLNGTFALPAYASRQPGEESMWRQSPPCGTDGRIGHRDQHNITLSASSGVFQLENGYRNHRDRP
jgi:PAS domain-containing protein